MGDVSWTVHTSPDGPVTVDYIVGEPPTLTPGETVRLRARFDGTSAYETIREYLDAAGSAATLTALDGTPFYRELHTGPRELLIGVEPSGPELPATLQGVWGVLTEGTDQTDSTVSNYGLELGLFVLAEFDEYPDRAAVKTVHER